MNDKMQCKKLKLFCCPLTQMNESIKNIFVNISSSQDHEPQNFNNLLKYLVYRTHLLLQ